MPDTGNWVPAGPPRSSRRVFCPHCHGISARGLGQQQRGEAIFTPTSLAAPVSTFPRFSLMENQTQPGKSVRMSENTGQVRLRQRGLRILWASGGRERGRLSSPSP